MPMAYNREERYTIDHAIMRYSSHSGQEVLEVHVVSDRGLKETYRFSANGRMEDYFISNEFRWGTRAAFEDAYAHLKRAGFFAQQERDIRIRRVRDAVQKHAQKLNLDALLQQQERRSMPKSLAEESPLERRNYCRAALGLSLLQSA